MFIAPHLQGKRLADLCHRLGVALAAGIDIRKVWQREASAAPRSYRGEFAKVRQGIEAGESFAQSLNKTGKLFPPLFREMVDVGERTGQIAEVLHKLADHYQGRHQLKRTFLMLLAWPLIQLTAAVLIIGLLIWILGALGASDMDGKPMDVLGFGLVGSSGVALYAAIVTACLFAVAALVIAFQRGAFWLRPVQRWLTSLPGVGNAIQKICLARISWTLHLLLNVEMDLRQMVPLVLRSTGNDFYIRHTEQMVADVASGQPLYVAFGNTVAFPPAFLDALAVAEESGQISESMARLTKQYEAEAESAMTWLAMIAGVAVWLLVAAMIIFMIFRLFTALYLKPIQDAMEM
ncbi:MAG: type II secretion system F family protein [Aeoliella sp.]